MHLINQILLRGPNALHLENFLRVEGTLGQCGAGIDDFPLMDPQAGPTGDLVLCLDIPLRHDDLASTVLILFETDRSARFGEHLLALWGRELRKAQPPGGGHG